MLQFAMGAVHICLHNRHSQTVTFLPDSSGSSWIRTESPDLPYGSPLLFERGNDCKICRYIFLVKSAELSAFNDA